MAQQTNYTNAAGTQAQVTKPGADNGGSDRRALYLKWVLKKL